MKQKLWKRLAAGALAICLFTAAAEDRCGADPDRFRAEGY